LAARDVLAVRREAARNRMVPVEGELGVASTTEQERIEAAFHEGTLALQARSREEHVLRWIYRSENMGQAARRGSPTSLKIRPGGTARATSTEWWLFFRVSRARVPRADVTRLFWEPNIRIYFFRALNVQIVFLESEFSNSLFFWKVNIVSFFG
jgi:hypothetical protein